uniref:Uncharacterized protein n=1 Tax=viral metagenome TaxID=1070528 RepID=A0A6C0LTF1_9ZZZZ
MIMEEFVFEKGLSIKQRIIYTYNKNIKKSNEYIVGEVLKSEYALRNTEGFNRKSTHAIQIWRLNMLRLHSGSAFGC